MSEERIFRVDVDYERDFVFKVHFGLNGVDNLIMDEIEPVGEGLGPDASRLLAAAVGNCLSASLLFCLRKSRVEISGMNTVVRGVTSRNEEGRWRIRELAVEISPDVSKDQRKKLQRCIEIFEQFCITSQSVKQGIPVNVNVNLQAN
jgi:organic hydroperoxide reductase OsmC/OhrA